MSEQPPATYRFKVSVETTSKYAQPSVTVYSDDIIEARTQAIAQYELTIEELEKRGFVVPPIRQTDAGT
jgi:hypothetical protein